MKLNVFVSSQKDGVMSKDKKFFPNLSQEERNILYQTTLTKFFERKNIKYENVIVLTDKNTEIKSRTVTEKMKQPKEAILLLKDTTKDLCVAVETSDYPVIIASANKEDGHAVTAVSLGTIENINNGLLHEIIESLIKETNAAPFEMTFYIGACPDKEKFKVDQNLLTNSFIWKDTYTKKKKNYYLDIRYAIFNSLIKEIVDPNNIYFDSTDTTIDDKYFSETAGKQGKNLVCAVYTDEEDV